MNIVLLIIGLALVLGVDDIWRGTKIGDVVNAILTIAALFFVACLIYATLAYK
jgi:hypothetical protein